MNYVKLLALAAGTVAVLIAVAGASLASATVLCGSTTTACAAVKPAATVIDADVKGSLAFKETGGGVLTTCTSGTIKAATANVGGVNETVGAPINNLVWGAVGAACTRGVVNVLLGSLEMHAIANTDNATLTGIGTEITLEALGLSCTYGFGAGTHLGTITGGKEPAIDVNTTLAKTAGGFLCPVTVKWTAEYTVKEPKPLYFEPN